MSSPPSRATPGTAVSTGQLSSGQLCQDDMIACGMGTGSSYSPLQATTEPYNREHSTFTA